MGGTQLVLKEEWVGPTCSRSPKDRVVPLPNGLNGKKLWVTNHLLTGMAVQLVARAEEWLLSDWDTRQLAVGDAVGKKLRQETADCGRD